MYENVKQFSSEVGDGLDRTNPRVSVRLVRVSGTGDRREIGTDHRERKSL